MYVQEMRVVEIESLGAVMRAPFSLWEKGWG
jgi:hypothetical protein